MRLWTHHSSSFKLDDPDIRVDSTRGSHWRKKRGANFRYKQVLPMLQALVGSDQLLWCYTKRGQNLPTSEPSDSVEWEINLPLVDMRLFSVPVWEDLVWSKGDDWDSLLLKNLGEKEAADDKNINALVCLPLPPDCLTCHGQLPPEYLKDNTKNPAYRAYIKRIGCNYFEFCGRL